LSQTMRRTPWRTVTFWPTRGRFRPGSSAATVRAAGRGPGGQGFCPERMTAVMAEGVGPGLEQEAGYGQGREFNRSIWLRDLDHQKRPGIRFFEAPRSACGLSQLASFNRIVGSVKQPVADIRPFAASSPDVFREE
jgi:hypothetical protein